MGLGAKATMDNYRELFSFPGDIMIQEIHASGIGRYNDIINDMDFFSKFKWTIKGPQSLDFTALFAGYRVGSEYVRCA